MEKIFKISMLLGVTIGLSSCLDEKPSMDPDAVENVIEFYATADIQVSPNDAVHPVFADAYDIKDEIDHNIIINYAGADVAPTDITVTVAVNEEAITEYNAWNNLHEDPENEEPDHDVYEPLPSNLYTIPSMTVTIPKGERKATLTVKLKTAQFDFSASYALGLTIVQASHGIISGNFSTALFDVKAKNKYDGVYTLKSRTMPSDRANFSNKDWEWPYEVHLVTTGAKTVYLFNAEYSNDATHPLQTYTVATDTYGWSRLGQFTPEFTFDDSDQLVDVANYIPNPTNGRAAMLNPDVTGSRYDKDEQTVYAAFLMTQPGFAPLPFYDTLVYVGPR